MLPSGHFPRMMMAMGGGAEFGPTSATALMLAQHDLLEDHLHHQQFQQQHLQHQFDQQQFMDIGQHALINSQDRGEMMQLPRLREEEAEITRSGSDAGEGMGSGDDQDQPANERPAKKKRYHRHTQHQIQEMETFFKHCPHPDDKQRRDLGRQLGLEPLQVKFWFQNKRTQMKTQYERTENNHLRAENEKLRLENLRYREALSSASCPTCGSPTAAGEVSFDGQHLRMENARLREEIDRITALAARYVPKQITSLPQMAPFTILNQRPGAMDLRPLPQNMLADIFRTNGTLMRGAVDRDYQEVDKAMVIELAVAAMEELIRMARLGEPLWINDGLAEKLNEEEYVRMFPRGIAPKPDGWKTEVTRDGAVVILSPMTLVGIMMDANQWSTMFAGIVSKAVTVEVLSTGMAGNYNGALQLMSAEFQVPSPLIPARENFFVRYSKRQDDGTWLVADVSLDDPRAGQVRKSLRLPSGCLIKETPNGYSKVIWVEHSEVDDSSVHEIYRQLVSTGLAFGAKRWVATLERQCERLSSVLASAAPSMDAGGGEVISSEEGRRGLLKLAQRLVTSFCYSVSGGSTHQWSDVAGNTDRQLDVKVMTQEHGNDPAKPTSILSAATSFWLAAPPKRVFNFLRDENSRSQWDILSQNGVAHKMAHIANGREQENCVTLLRVNSPVTNQSNMLILQESFTDATGSYVVYAPVDIAAMSLVLSGGNTDCVTLLPSGFAILPDGGPSQVVEEDGSVVEEGVQSGGTLLTVMFQILVDSGPMKMPSSSVAKATVNHLISCTVDKIKAAVSTAGEDGQ